MVHPNVDITCAEEPRKPGPEDLEFFFASGQVRLKSSLLLPQPWHVRVAEHGHAVRRERQYLVDRLLKGVGGLKWQSVNQVDIQAPEAQLACRDNQGTRQLIGLHAPDRLLYLGLEILNAHAEPVKSEPPQCFQMGAICYPRVDFDPDFGI